MRARICVVCKNRKFSKSFDGDNDACRVCARGVKRCYGCKAEKPVEAFYKTGCNRDGLHSYCIECVRARTAIKDRERARRQAELVDERRERQATVIQMPNSNWTLDDLATRDCQVCGVRNPPGHRFCSIPHRENTLSLEEHAVMRPRAGEAW